MLSQTKMGKEHRDHGDNVVNKKGLSSRIAKYFFGEYLEGKLSVETFIEFQKQLKEEVQSLEFDAYRPDVDDTISAMQFVDSDNIVSILYAMMGDLETNDLKERQFRKIVKTRTTFGLKTSEEHARVTKKLYALWTCLGPQYNAFIRHLSSKDTTFCSTVCRDR